MKGGKMKLHKRIIKMVLIATGVLAVGMGAIFSRTFKKNQALEKEVNQSQMIKKSISVAASDCVGTWGKGGR
jgi:hypothetical protein